MADKKTSTLRDDLISAVKRLVGGGLAGKAAKGLKDAEAKKHKAIKEQGG